ncbi:MAG: trypsin-like serine protease [Phycisphaerae bacterium]
MRSSRLVVFARSLGLSLGAAMISSARAQEILTAPLSSHEVLAVVDSGPVANEGPELCVVFSTTVAAPGAAWIRLNFDSVLLAGDEAAGDGSFLIVTSMLDGAYQHLNARHVREWHNTSAYLNGDMARIDLYAHPGAGPNRLVMSKLTAGDPPPAERSICGTTDDRQLSDDPRAARVLPVGCTAWLINDCGHCFLTAGHCTSELSVIEFNVPLSSSSGGLNHPPPEDQYSVDNASVQTNGGQGQGNDWGYFGCFANSTTGLTPYAAQDAAFDLASVPPPVSGQQIRITGYGTTSPPVPNQWNQVQKTHLGPYFSFAGTTVTYQTDTTGGNSGSPVVDESTGLAIGIHTHGGCSTGGGANVGTGINHAGLQAALAAPQGVCLQAQPLLFTYPNDRPTLIDPAGGTTVRVEVAPNGNLTPQPDTGILHYDGGGGVLEVPMTQVTPNVYDAVFPPVTCDSVVQYYMSVEATNGQRYYDPGGCGVPPDPYAATALISTATVADDAFEVDSGWTAGAPGDSATIGIWGRTDPEPTGAQPGDDHTAGGTQCWVTDGRAGPSVGSYDVDGGATTLLSPVYDLGSGDDAHVSYWRWYSNDEGTAPNADTFVVDVSNDGGSAWTTVETVGPAGAQASGGWFFHEFRLSDFVSTTAAVRLRFVASDLAEPSLVEAAIDDLRVTSVTCAAPCPGDLDGDGQVGLGDLSRLLGNFGVSSGMSYDDGDLTGDGAVDLADLSRLLELYGSSCP